MLDRLLRPAAGDSGRAAPRLRLPPHRRLAATAVATACAVVSLTGCVKLRQHTKVMPDGAARFRMTFGVSKQLTEGMGAAGTSGPFDRVKDPAEFCEGYVAASPVDMYEKDGFSYMSFTLWTEDVNRLVVRSPKDAGASAGSGSGDAPLKFGFERTGSGFTLSVSGGPMTGKGSAPQADDPELPPEMAKAAEEMAKAMAEAMKAMMKGLEVSETWEMPGAVTPADFLTEASGRTASLRITDEDLLDPAKAAKLKTTAARAIRCGTSTVSAAEAAEFRAEFDAARADFAKRVAAGLARPAPGGPKPPASPSPSPPADPAPAVKPVPAGDGDAAPPADGPKKPRVTIRRKGE